VGHAIEDPLSGLLVRGGFRRGGFRNPPRVRRAIEPFGKIAFGGRPFGLIDVEAKGGLLGQDALVHLL